MREQRFWLIPVLVACALFAAGCGDDSDGGGGTTTTSSPAETAESNVDSAVKECVSKSDDIGGSVGVGLKATCESVGDTAKKALESGSEDVKQALVQASSSCKSAVDKLPAGEAQDALSSLCKAISGDE